MAGENPNPLQTDRLSMTHWAVTTADEFVVTAEEYPKRAHWAVTTAEEFQKGAPVASRSDEQGALIEPKKPW